MSFEGKIKGVHLLNVINYIKHKRGVLGLNVFLKTINEGKAIPEHADETSYIEKEWYPYELYLKFLELADQITGKGDLSKCYDIGLQTLQNLGHLSYVARAPDIAEFVETAQKSWRNVYDFGHFEYTMEGDKKMIFQYHGFPPNKAKDQYFKGSLMGMMDLCKLDGNVELTKSNTSMDDYTEYVLTWK